jgi:hypothetical protein
LVKGRFQTDTQPHVRYILPQKNRPPKGGRLGFRLPRLRLEAPARHAGVEHSHGAVDDVSHLGVRSIEEQHEDGGQVQEVCGIGQNPDAHQAEEPGEQAGGAHGEDHVDQKPVIVGTVPRLGGVGLALFNDIPDPVEQRGGPSHSQQF